MIGGNQTACREPERKSHRRPCWPEQCGQEGVQIVRHTMTFDVLRHVRASRRLQTYPSSGSQEWMVTTAAWSLEPGWSRQPWCRSEFVVVPGELAPQ